jgi:predicted transposase/invertase (TIGR01784 family)
MYDRTLKAKRDWHNMLDYAQKEAIKKGWEEGMEKGMEKGIEKGMEKNAIKIALAMHKDGFHIEKIAQLTGLSIEQLIKFFE